MIAILLSLLAVFIILVISELLWNVKKLRGEFGRKFVHITVGTFVAFWPYYMSFRVILYIALAFLAVVFVSRYLKIFRAVNTIDRKSWGDVLFAVAIGLAALLTKTDWIFTVAILNLSLADGLAGIIGKRFGKKNSYKVFGYNKSLVGTITFWATSLIIMVLVSLIASPPVISIGAIIWLSLATALIENIGVYGLDNILVPMLIVLVLGSFK